MGLWEELMGCWALPPGCRQVSSVHGAPGPRGTKPPGKALRDRLWESHTSQEPGDEQINFSLGYYTASVADDSWPWTGSLEVSGESVNKILSGWTLCNCIRVWKIFDWGDQPASWCKSVCYHLHLQSSCRRSVILLCMAETSVAECGPVWARPMAFASSRFSSGGCWVARVRELGCRGYNCFTFCTSSVLEMSQRTCVLCTASFSGGGAPAPDLCCNSRHSSGQTAPDVSLWCGTETATMQAVSTTSCGPKDNVSGVVTGLCASCFLVWLSMRNFFFFFVLPWYCYWPKQTKFRPENPALKDKHPVWPPPLAAPPLRHWPTSACTLPRWGLWCFATSSQEQEFWSWSPLSAGPKQAYWNCLY